MAAPLHCRMFYVRGVCFRFAEQMNYRQQGQHKRQGIHTEQLALIFIKITDAFAPQIWEKKAQEQPYGAINPRTDAAAFGQIGQQKG